MKNPTYAKFMDEVEHYISNLTIEELKNIIVNLAESQDQSDRNEFLKKLKATGLSGKDTDVSKTGDVVYPQKLIKEIKNYQQRILDGEFFDEEASYMAYEREERSYYRNNYYDEFDEDIDFSQEEYVLEAIEYLEQAKKLFRIHDIDNAYEAYDLLFDIFDKSAYYEDNECLIFGFSYEQAIGREVFKEYKTIYRRCHYLKIADTRNFDELFCKLCKDKDIMLTDIIEIGRTPLPYLDIFISAFIEYMKDNAKYDSLLIDTLFVKGGMEEVKKYAYTNGIKHPAVFLYYYDYAKESQFPQSELLTLILDGLKIIPEKYDVRARLSLDLIEISKDKKDNELLLKGLSTAFYSDPTLKNMTNLLEFLISENISAELEKLKEYLHIDKVDKTEKKLIDFDDINPVCDIYSLKKSKIDFNTVNTGRFLLEGIEPLLEFINPKHFLGFQSQKKHVAIITSLTLKTISGASGNVIVDKLVDHYCLNIGSDYYPTLKRLIAKAAISYPLSQEKIDNTLKSIESLAVKRVSHILKNKLRGGYESACLLLVACAEVKQMVNNHGNALINIINTQYKRFSAFRRPLKELTSQSKILDSVK